MNPVEIEQAITDLAERRSWLELQAGEKLSASPGMVLTCKRQMARKTRLKDGQPDHIGAQGQTEGNRPAAMLPIAGPPETLGEGLAQRFSNLINFGKFNTDEQQNDYIAAAATTYMQGGNQALQDFMQKDSPVSGTKSAMTMLAGGVPGLLSGGVRQLGTITVTASAQDIIASNAQRIADGGFEVWKTFLSAAEQRAFNANPSVRSMLARQAVHRGVERALFNQFGDRFQYFTKGSDFLDKSTGELIELTTPGQVGAHMARPGYGAMTYSTYTLPPLQ